MPSVLVTGAARGIGRATVLRLANAGWDVYAGVRKAADGDELANAPSRITPLVFDIVNEDEVKSVAAQVPALGGLVNNAGIALIEADTDAAEAGLRPEAKDLYRDHFAGFRKAIPMSQKMAAPADNVARSIERALTVRRPKARYVVGFGPKVQVALSSATPTPVTDALFRKVLGIPGQPR